ncbi:hypothetical protein ACEPAH_9117 [Sanghuangporus vaninii]
MLNLSSPYVSGGDAANMSTSEDALIIKPQAPIKNYERALGELASQYGFGGRAPAIHVPQRSTLALKDRKNRKAMAKGVQVSK